MWGFSVNPKVFSKSFHLDGPQISLHLSSAAAEISLNSPAVSSLEILGNLAFSRSRGQPGLEGNLYTDVGPPSWFSPS